MTGPKVTYEDGLCRDGVTPFRTTAYLDHDDPIDGYHYGVNKHTDYPVVLRWTGDHWESIGDVLGPMPCWWYDW